MINNIQNMIAAATYQLVPITICDWGILVTEKNERGEKHVHVRYEVCKCSILAKNLTPNS